MRKIKSRDQVVCVKLTKAANAWRRGHLLHATVFIGAGEELDADHYPVGTVFEGVIPLQDQRRLQDAGKL